MKSSMEKREKEEYKRHENIKTIMRQDREPYRAPPRVQDVIPIQCDSS